MKNRYTNNQIVKMLSNGDNKYPKYVNSALYGWLDGVMQFICNMKLNPNIVIDDITIDKNSHNTWEEGYLAIQKAFIKYMKMHKLGVDIHNDEKLAKFK